MKSLAKKRSVSLSHLLRSREKKKAERKLPGEVTAGTWPNLWTVVTYVR